MFRKGFHARPGKADQVIQGRAKIFESVKMDSRDIFERWTISGLFKNMLRRI